jgi:hypothetical protein
MCEVSAEIGRGGSDQLESQKARRNRVFSHGLVYGQHSASQGPTTAPDLSER